MAGAAIILSANPIHDTGGGQRSAQLALELLERGFAVLFVSHGKVTETVDLGIQYRHAQLTNTSLAALTSAEGAAALEPFLRHDRVIVVTQVPVRRWEPVLATARSGGAVCVYDCIDRWDSELGRGWYRKETEERIAKGADVLIASAPELVHHVEILAERRTSLVPNAYNSRVFQAGADVARPLDLPGSGRIALYVGALWGGWLDWSLVARAAKELQDTNFVFVGDHRREGRGLPANCVFLGLKPQTELPGYLAHADLAFLPWSADEVTQATSPLKVYEFVAMGLPVVGPAIEPLEGIPGVRRFGSPSDFVAACAEVERTSLDPAAREEMAAFARKNSWVDRVDTIEQLVRDTAEQSSRGLASRVDRGRRSTPMISVVIPAYNHERWVGRAVDSVRSQTLPAGELIVVDDGSRDDTPAALERHRFSGTSVIRQENRGAHAAINRGVALSRGDYVAILNSDDEFAPDRLEHAWGVARSAAAALVVGGVRLIDADGTPLPPEHDSARWYREARREPSRTRSLARALLRHNFAVTTSNFFFHRELWRVLGGFAAYRYVHDYDFILRALEICPDRVIYVDALEDVLYRVHGENTILEDVPAALEERRTMLSRIRSPGRRVRSLLGRSQSRTAVGHAVDSADDPTPLADDSPALDRALRVGLVVRSLDEGGLEEVVALLAQTLPGRGMEPHVLCTHAGGAVATRLAASGVDVRIAAGRSSEWQRWAADVQPHLFSTHFVDLATVEALADTGAPLFETVHNTYAWFGKEDWSRESRKRGHLRATVAVSDLVARYYARYTETEPTPHVIPNGVHPARAASVPRSWARQRLGLPPEAPVLVHLGRVTLQKNVLGLLRAFEAVLEAEPQARLILAGSLTDRGYVRQVRRAHRALLRSGSVRLLPPVPHAGTVLSAADAYVSNSFFEGWSLAASEAAWQGLPLVLSDCGSARRMVGEDGARGLVVPNPLGDPMEVTWDRLKHPSVADMAANEQSLATAIRQVLSARESWSGRRDEMRRHARSELAPGLVGASYARLFAGVATG